MPHQSPDTVTVSVNAPGVADIDPLDSVGRIYEIGLNGKGYMLDDHPEDDRSKVRRAVPNLDVPRLATSDTPLSQSIERYVLETFHDWSGGAGQKWLNREGSSSRMFFDSEGVDPFTTRGELSLLPTTTQSLAQSYSGLKIVTVGNDLFALVSDDELRYTSDGETWEPAFEVTDASGQIVINDLTSDGQYWYAATGSSIVRGTTSDPAASWSTEAADRIAWAAGRICAAVADGTSTTPNKFTTLAEDGTEEETGGHLTLDEGHTIVLGGAAAGAFYFGSYAGDKGLIWQWDLGVDDNGAFHEPFVAWEMPQGVIPTAVAVGGGEVWIRALRAEGPSAGDMILYRGIPDQQGLTPFIVDNLGNTEREGDFVEIADKVVFSWEDTSGNAALGAVYLPTGGYCRWLSTGVTGEVTDVVEFRGLETFVVSGQGVYVRDSSNYVTSGWVQTSIVDGGSILDKVLDDITIEAPPLDSGESIEVKYSLDGGGSYTSAGELSGGGAQRKEIFLNKSTATFGLEIVLEGDGSSSTTGHSVQAKYHALGLRDVIVSFRVKAYDNMTGLNGAPLKDNRQGRGAEIMREIEELGQSRVLFQDVDWHLLGQARVFEVIDVQTSPTLIYDRYTGENEVGGWVDVTLRRAST